MRKQLFVLLVLMTLTLPRMEADAQEEPKGSAEIIAKYLAATQAHPAPQVGSSMEVEIDASIPSLKKQGKLHALRKISKLGQITYRVLGFQGDTTVKKDVIARYLSAEQQVQSDNKLAVTPDNYKFKFKGRQRVQGGPDIFVYALSPRKKQVGLFKGEIWLDAKTCLPLLEKGRFVKNPTIFFKKVDFERAYAIKNGVSVPQHVSSTIDTRLVGRVELDVSYSNFETEEASDTAGPAFLNVSNLSN